jgi:hypothetical protein
VDGAPTLGPALLVSHLSHTPWLARTKPHWVTSPFLDLPPLCVIPISKWKEASRPFHLTLAYVQSLQRGDQMLLLHMDRNFEDLLDTTYNTEEKAVHPTILMKRNYYSLYSNAGGTKVKWLSSEGPDPSPKMFDDTDGCLCREWEIEYEPGCWYPLEQGYLPARDPQGFAGFSYSKPRHYSTFPTTTRIGWRGPVMLIRNGSCRWFTMTNKQSDVRLNILKPQNRFFHNKLQTQKK